MESLSLRQFLYDSQEYHLALQLRDVVLRKPLGLAFTEKDLQVDAQGIHLGAFISGKLVGCLILNPQAQGVYKMRQVAVDPTFQGRGIGKALVVFAEQVVQEVSGTKIELAARDTVVPFYESLQYQKEGNPFEEVTISHQKMFKQMNSSSDSTQRLAE
jgi:predicted GNAT family N-acyltransferase